MALQVGSRWAYSPFARTTEKAIGNSPLPVCVDLGVAPSHSTTGHSPKAFVQVELPCPAAQMVQFSVFWVRVTTTAKAIWFAFQKQLLLLGVDPRLSGAFL